MASAPRAPTASCARRRTAARAAAASIGRPYRFAGRRREKPSASLQAPSPRGRFQPMETWNITELDVQPHKPTVLHSEVGAARAILIHLPAGEMLQDHEVHEHAFLH